MRSHWWLIPALAADLWSLCLGARPLLDHGASFLFAPADQGNMTLSASGQLDEYGSSGSLVSRTARLGTKCVETRGLDGEIIGTQMIGEVERSWNDVRQSVKKVGWVRGILGRIGQIGSILVGTRLIPVEMTADQALETILATYGIVVAKVPFKCFDELHKNLDNKDLVDEDDMKKMKIIRANLRYLIERRVEFECDSSILKPTAAGMQAKEALTHLRFGYWTLFNELTSSPPSKKVVPKVMVIAAQSTDAVRFRKNQFPVRQIWHFLRMHMYGRLPDLMRREIQIEKEELGPFADSSSLEKQAAKATIKRLKQQLKRMSRVYTMHYGTLRHIEFPVTTSSRDPLSEEVGCINAPTDGSAQEVISFLMAVLGYESTGTWDKEFVIRQLFLPGGIIRSLTSGMRLFTFLFRERWASGKATSIYKFVRHPMVGFKAEKWRSRLDDEWHTMTTLGKLAMVISPIMKLISIAGIVMGVVTGGQSTLLTVIVNAIAQEAAWGLVMAGSSMTEFILNQMVCHVAVTAVYEGLNEAEGQDKVIRLWSHLGGIAEVQQVRFRLEQEFEDVYESTEVQLAMAQIIDETGSDGDDDNPVSVEQGVRRMIWDNIASSFASELSEPLQSALEKYFNEHFDPDFGWISYMEWVSYVKNHNTKTKSDIQNRAIKWVVEGVPDDLPGKQKEYFAVIFPDPQGLNPNDLEADGQVEVMVLRREEQTFGRALLFVTSKYLRNQGLLTGEHRNGMKLTLTRDLKRGLKVKDREVYTNARGGWIQYDWWMTYQPKGNRFRRLQDKLVRIVKGQHDLCDNWKESYKADLEDEDGDEWKCIQSIMVDAVEAHDEDDGATVPDTGAKVSLPRRLGAVFSAFGTPPLRVITPVDPTSTIPLFGLGDRCSFPITSTIARCLWVKDEDMFRLYSDDLVEQRTRSNAVVRTMDDDHWAEVDTQVTASQFKVEEQILLADTDDPIEQAVLANDIIKENTNGEGSISLEIEMENPTISTDTGAFSVKTSSDTTFTVDLRALNLAITDGVKVAKAHSIKVSTDQTDEDDLVLDDTGDHSHEDLLDDNPLTVTEPVLKKRTVIVDDTPTKSKGTDESDDR